MIKELESLQPDTESKDDKIRRLENDKAILEQIIETYKQKSEMFEIKIKDFEKKIKLFEIAMNRVIEKNKELTDKLSRKSLFKMVLVPTPYGN